jgi:hypothetical protein
MNEQVINLNKTCGCDRILFLFIHDGDDRALFGRLYVSRVYGERVESVVQQQWVPRMKRNDTSQLECSKIYPFTHLK